MRSRFSVGIKDAFEIGVLEGNRQMTVEVLSLLEDEHCDIALLRIYLRTRYKSFTCTSEFGRLLGYVEQKIDIDTE